MRERRRGFAERGQHSVIDAVTQNATGFTASPAPGNGSLSFNTRGFTGNSSVMTLYDGTRLYVGSGTLTFPIGATSETFTVPMLNKQESSNTDFNVNLSSPTNATTTRSRATI